MKSAIITGANGFIGTELCKTLSYHNIKVYAVLRCETSYSEELRKLKNVVPVFCDMDNILHLYNQINSADVFFHLVWAGITGKDRGDYNLQIKSIRWEMEAIAAAKKVGCKRFVGAGTTAEQDVYAYSSLDGSTPNIVSEYGAAKIAARFMSKAECNTMGMDHLWAIIPNTYGADDRSSNFINFAYDLLASNVPANFTSGEQYYDFVEVRDVANGLFHIGMSGKNNHSYYIGSGKPRRLKEYIKTMRDIINPDKELHLGAIPYNGVSVPIESFDCSKLSRDTGYEAQISFENGVQAIRRSK